MNFLLYIDDQYGTASCTSCTTVHAQCKTESVKYKDSSGTDLYCMEDADPYMDHGRFFPETSYGNCRSRNH